MSCKKFDFDVLDNLIDSFIADKKNLKYGKTWDSFYLSNSNFLDKYYFNIEYELQPDIRNGNCYLIKLSKKDNPSNEYYHYLSFEDSDAEYNNRHEVKVKAIIKKLDKIRVYYQDIYSNEIDYTIKNDNNNLLLDIKNNIENNYPDIKTELEKTIEEQKEIIKKQNIKIKKLQYDFENQLTLTGGIDTRTLINLEKRLKIVEGVNEL